MDFNKKGFTLIEILISITILSFMSIAVFNIVNQSTDTQERVTKEDQELLEIESALKKLDYDFSQLFTPLYYSSPQEEEGESDQSDDGQDEYNSTNPTYSEHDYFDGTSKSGHPIPAIFYEKNTEFILFTFSNKRKFENSKESQYSWVRYYLSTSDENKNLLQLNRQMKASDIYGSDLDWSKTPSYSLTNTIKKLEIFFWDLEKEEWVDSIPEKNKYFSPIIRVNLIWQDINGNENYIDRTFRILWPTFDTAEHDKLVKAAMYPEENENDKDKED